ncbi:MAG TPA: hypothetical protein VJR06_09570 [Nitrososphaerales archaeon]|nr:hypothetical protein [Nitrososphaerales archaeon]
MKLCQKCIAALDICIHDFELFKGSVGLRWSPPVPESECEFWAHKELNTVRFDYNLNNQPGDLPHGRIEFEDSKRKVVIITTATVVEETPKP